MYLAVRWHETTMQHLRTIGPRAFVHFETHTMKLEDIYWKEGSSGRARTPRRTAYKDKVERAGTSCSSRRHRKWCHHTSTSQTTSIRWENVTLISFRDGPEDEDTLRDVPNYTSRVGFNNGVTYDHITPIVQPRDAGLTEIRIIIRGFNGF